jgi:exonuclease VII large subunit
MREEDYSKIISAASEAASGAIKHKAELSSSKRELKEKKKRTLSDLFSKAMRRNRELNQFGREHRSEARDYQSQSLQDMARGFSESLKGMYRR